MNTTVQSRIICSPFVIDIPRFVFGIRMTDDLWTTGCGSVGALTQYCVYL